MAELPLNFYQNQINDFEAKLKSIKQKLVWVGMLRLSVFLLTGFACYFLRDSINIAVVVGVVGLALFLFIVSKNTDIKLEKKRLQKLLELNNLEIRVLGGDIQGLDAGKQFITEGHHYNQDIDLFGEGSIFQFINRSATANGARKLAGILNSNNIDGVEKKQAAIHELSQLAKWRQNFQTTAALVEAKVEDGDVLAWLKKYSPTIPNLFKRLPLVFSIASLGVFVVYGFSLISLELLVMWLFVGIAITGVYFKRISNLYQSASQMTATFAQYSKLLNEIEGRTFTAQLLVDLQNEIKSENKKASTIFKDLSKELNSLDQRNNFLFAFIANGFFLWDLRYAYRIEMWIKTYQPLTEKWFRVIGQFDAYNSLGNYAFNYPQHIYPELSTGGNRIMSATELGHPLLKADQRVSNDFSIKDEDFFIVTGANMAGKSTFLRTVALNMVLANVGLPVCAKSFIYTPIKLISSMRTSDSLVNDESYFFSELKRLKFIIDEIKADRYFIILDEILKGTNSKDKAEGSKKFVEKLVATNSSGIIATHDLSLCELEQTLPQVENHYFDAEIVNDELYFDYRFKKGICQNMNASFLLRKMEIV